MKLEHIEKCRTYVYRNGFKLSVHNITSVTVSDSGNHRLETECGKKYIVAPNWIAIELDTEQWTF